MDIEVYKIRKRSDMTVYPDLFANKKAATDSIQITCSRLSRDEQEAFITDHAVMREFIHLKDVGDHL